MMSLEERLEHALEERDLVSVKAHLTSFIDKYPRNENDAAMLAFEVARSRCPEVVQQHDGEPLEIDRAKWDEDYLAIVMDDLIDNFSPERFLHAIAVSTHIHKRKYAPESEDDEYNDDLFTLPPRKIDLSVWLLLIASAILFLVIFYLIRSAL